MTKILQLRRGTAAEHENFVGMPGEATINTNTHTLCIHDGVCAGGHELARADLSNIDKDALATAVADVVGNGGFENGPGGNGGFDINSVSRDFWDALFREHNIKSANFAQSVACNIITAPYAEYIFDIDRNDFNPITAVADVVLVSQSNEAGYAPGDVVYAFGIGTRATPHPHAYADANGVRTRLMLNNETLWVSHKTNGGPVNINNNNWKMVFRIWY